MFSVVFTQKVQVDKYKMKRNKHKKHVILAMLLTKKTLLKLVPRCFGGNYAPAMVTHGRAGSASKFALIHRYSTHALPLSGQVNFNLLVSI